MSIFSEARVWKVTAGPGCGKSHFITQTIQSLLAEGVKPTEIAYILFNRKPAVAFREQFNLAQDDMIWWSTHHSFCRRLLGLKVSNILNTHTWGKIHGFDLSSEESIKHEGIAEYGWDAVFSALQKKIYEDRTDFTREELRLLNAMKDTEVKEGKYAHIRYLQKALKMDMFPVSVKYLFVDEAQDNGKLQLDWVQRIIDTRPQVQGILLAGDDKQAINGFKGGNAELFLDFPCDKEINLRTTYRLPSKILREANRVISPVKKRSELTSESASQVNGQVIYTSSFEDAIPDIIQGVKEKKSILVLLRNRCFEKNVAHSLMESDVLLQSDWNEQLKKTLAALWQIRSTGLITEDTLSVILPSSERSYGQIKPEFYWDVQKAKSLRSGDFWTDRVMFDAYELMRIGNGLPIERAEEIGMKKNFLQDIMLWSLNTDAIHLPATSLYNFKRTVKRFGWDFVTVRVDTIHSVKGEEADMVVLVGNITEKTRVSEEDDEDAERRVWFVGLTRAREKLIITQLPQYDKFTCIL